MRVKRQTVKWQGGRTSREIDTGWTARSKLEKRQERTKREVGGEKTVKRATGK